MLIYLIARGEKLTQRLAEDSVPMRTLLYQCFAGLQGEKALKILDLVSEEMQRERERLSAPATRSTLNQLDARTSPQEDSVSISSPAAQPARRGRAREMRKRLRPQMLEP